MIDLKDHERMYSFNSSSTVDFETLKNKTPWVAAIPNIVFEMEAVMKSMPQVELEVKHHFSKGVYARELIIPAGVTLCGEIHKYENLNILSQGTMLLYGEGQISAPFTVVSPPGTKRIAYTITDCIWITIHGTDETDVDVIKAKFIAQSEAEYLDFIGASQLMLGFN